MDRENPFPGLCDTMAELLKAQTFEWQGTVDPDRDLWDCQKEHPDIEIQDSWLILQSPSITISYGDERYSLGSYWIQVDLSTSGLIITRKDRCCYIHPHVNGQGHLCFGDAYAPYHSALGQGRYGDALSVVIQVLRNYNPDDCIYRLSSCVSEWTCEGCGVSLSRNDGLCEECRKESL